MEVTKRGQVNYPGNMNVKGVLNSATLTTNDLEVGNNTSISNELSVGGNAVISGDLVVTGKIINECVPEHSLDEEPVCNDEFKDGTVYLGDKTAEGTWRLRVEDGELLIERLEEGEWEIKQSMS